MSFVVIIPARYASTRLPGKPLVDINGKPMIVHVLERARESGAERIIVATDHEDVARAVEAAGGEVCMTRADHQSGTERLAEVVEKCAFSDDTVIVNVQGDEPMIPATIIRQVADNLAQRQVGMATLAVPIHNAEEAFNPNAVKVVLDAEGYALYFSRATIPWDRDRFAEGLETVGDNFLRHLGNLWLPCRLYPSLRQLAGKSVRTHRNVRAASCSVVRRKNPCCCCSGSSWHRCGYP